MGHFVHLSFNFVPCCNFGFTAPSLPPDCSRTSPMIDSPLCIQGQAWATEQVMVNDWMNSLTFWGVEWLLLTPTKREIVHSSRQGFFYSVPCCIPRESMLMRRKQTLLHLSPHQNCLFIMAPSSQGQRYWRPPWNNKGMTDFAPCVICITRQLRW